MMPRNALSAHRFIMRTALASAHAFVWIFIFQYFGQFLSLAEALERTVLLYALAYATAATVTPFAARQLRHGMGRGIGYGVLCAAIALVTAGGSFAGFFGYPYADGIVAFAFAWGLYRALYWVPYSVERNELGQKRSMIAEAIIAFAPLLSGLLLVDAFAPAALLFAAGALLLLSAVPLFWLPTMHESFSWGYVETFGELFSRNHRKPLVRSVLEGAQSATLALLWPIVIFLIAGSSYVALGLILSATFLMAILLRKPIRMLLHRANLERSAFVGASIAASAWIARILVATPVTIVLVDLYYQGSIGNRGAIAAHVTDHAADAGSYVDEFTALKEMGNAFGRILVCVITACVAILFSFSTALVIAFCIAALSAVGAVYAVLPRHI